MNDVIHAKPVLRAKMRAARDAFVANGAPVLTVPAAFLARLRPGLIVASYLPLGGEADPAPLAAAATERGARLALPFVVNRVTPLRFLAWQPGDALETGAFGLQQPGADAEAVAPDIILTPLVAFDAALNRVGQGAGHYDRAFEAFPAAWRIGVAWSVQQVDALRPDPWDIPLHAIITDQSWLTL